MAKLRDSMIERSAQHSRGSEIVTFFPPQFVHGRFETPKEMWGFSRNKQPQHLLCHTSDLSIDTWPSKRIAHQDIHPRLRRLRDENTSRSLHSHLSSSSSFQQATSLPPPCHARQPRSRIYAFSVKLEQSFSRVSVAKLMERLRRYHRYVM